MPLTSPSPELSVEEQKRLQVLVTSILDAWGHQDFVAPQRFLPDRTTRLWAAAILHAVRADLERHWPKGQAVLIEKYLDHVPGLRENNPLLMQLLIAEYEIRHEHGDRPALPEYQARFPAVFQAFKEHIQKQLTAVQTSVGGAATPHETPPPAPAAPQAATEVLEVGGYHLFRLLGRGAFGEVYQAEAPGGVEVAVKRILQPMGRKDAEQELAALELIKKLRHNALLQLHAFWIDDTSHQLHVAMELAEGSLRDRSEECLQQGMPGIPIQELMGYFYEAAEALDYLHSKNIIHRDVKPENILRVGTHAKLADFGIAKGLQGGLSSESAGMGGTMNYMAPEVWESRVSTKSDQYSLAVAYVELRLGKLPFRGANLIALMNAHLTGEPDLEGMGAPEQAVLHIALAKSTKERFPSCVAFCKALIEALEPAQRPDHRTSQFWDPTSPTATLPPVAPKAEPPAPPVALPAPAPAEVPVVPPAKRRRWWPAGAALVGALALLAPALMYLRQPGPWLPTDYRPGERGVYVTPQGNRLYHTLVLSRPGLPPEEFLLIPPDPDDDLPPYYMMKDKVTRELYELCPNLTGPKLAPGEDGRLPALGMIWQDARACAQWLGGDLPTLEEWDKAAGKLRKDLEGPFQGKYADLVFPRDIAFGLQAPVRVGTAEKDVSYYGCRDMAGNGREWTRTLAEQGDTYRPWKELGAPKPKATFVLRGHSFNAQERQDLQFQNWIFLDMQQHDSSVSTIGFRVVLKPGP